MSKDGLVADTEYTKPLAITNSFGVPSRDPDFWQRDLADTVAYAKKGQLVIGGFQGTTNVEGSVDEYIRNFARTARLVREAGAPVLEGNLSCPNEGTAHLLCFDTDRTERIVGAIRKEIGDTPFIIKLAYFENQEQLRDFIARIGGMVDGIAAINTIPTKIFKDSSRTEPALPGSNRLVSGVCGEPIKWAGLDMTRRLSALRNELGYHYKIFGVGGVVSPKDYFAYRDAGADVVMSATGAMWNPYLAQEVKAARIAD